MHISAWNCHTTNDVLLMCSNPQGLHGWLTQSIEYTVSLEVIF